MAKKLYPVKNAAGVVIDSVTAKERQFVKALVEQGGNVAKAAEVVGVHRSTGYRYINERPGLLVMYNEALARAGIDDDAIAQTIKDAMGATRRVMMPDGKGGVETAFDPDHKIRLDAVTLAANLSIKSNSLNNGHDPDREVGELPPDMAGVETTTIMREIVKITRRGY